MRSRPVKATLSVRSLPTTAERLSEDGINYLPVSGMTFTDRRLSLLDPAGNRVELKQEWRHGTFAGQDQAEPGQTTPGRGSKNLEKKR
ncbi:MAG: hypothetical protein GY778_11025 [bacterium]|nr:hypothetical protein [bacterium]